MTTREPAAPYAELMVLLAKYNPKRYFPKANNIAVIAPPSRHRPKISEHLEVFYITPQTEM